MFTISFGSDDHLWSVLSLLSCFGMSRVKDDLPGNLRHASGSVNSMFRLNRCPAHWRRLYIRNYHGGTTTPSKGDKGMSTRQTLQTLFDIVLSMQS